MTKTDELLREFAEKWGIRYQPEEPGYYELKNDSDNCLSDLRTLIVQVEEERMPKREPITWNQVKEKYLEFHKIDAFTENMAIDIDFGYWLVNSSRLTKDGAKASQKTEGGEG